MTLKQKQRIVAGMARRWERDDAKLVELFGDDYTDDAPVHDAPEILRNLETAIACARSFLGRTL